MAVTLTIKNVTTPAPKAPHRQLRRTRGSKRDYVAPTEIDCERPERDLPEHPEAEQHDAVARDQPEVGACEGHLLLFPSPLPKPDQGSAARMQTAMLMPACCPEATEAKPAARQKGTHRIGAVLTKVLQQRLLLLEGLLQVRFWV